MDDMVSHDDGSDASHREIAQDEILSEDVIGINPSLRRVTLHFAQADEPADIHWKHIVKAEKSTHLLRNIFTHLILIVLFTFFTTPVAAFSGMQISTAKLPVF